MAVRLRRRILPGQPAGVAGHIIVLIAVDMLLLIVTVGRRTLQEVRLEKLTVCDDPACLAVIYF